MFSASPAATRRLALPGSLLLVLAVLLALVWARATPALDTALSPVLERLPLLFLADGPAAATAHGPGAALDFAPDGVTLHLPADQTVRLAFLGANPAPRLAPAQPLSGIVNLYAGADPATWRTGETAYAGLAYEALYPGVDLLFRGETGHLKGTFTIAPGADPGAIAWRYEGVAGATVTAGGDLVLALADGDNLVERAPVAWQTRHGRQVAVPVAYALGAGGRVGFALGAYDATRPLVVDPEIVYETVIGAVEFETGVDLAADATGNAYVLADTYGYDGNDVLLARLNPDGSIGFVTIIGGSQIDDAGHLALDGAGHLYLTGRTLSPNFPVLNALQPAMNGFSDVFVMKLNAANGQMLFSTFLGSTRAERHGGIAVDAAGDILVSGATDFTDFPVTPDAYQPELNLEQCFCFDAFLARIAGDGSAILYATYLGGWADDFSVDVGVDTAGNAYLTGLTESPDFPTADPLQAFYGGEQDGWAARLSADGSTLDYGTFLGGSDWDQVRELVVAADGTTTIAGYTESANYPTTPGSFQPGFAGGILDCGSPPFIPLRNCYDGFVTRLAPDGSAFVYSTFLGGDEDDMLNGVTIDGAGNTYLAGWTYSVDFPGVPGNAGFVVPKLSADGSALLYTQPLETNDADGHGIALDPHGAIYVTGSTNVPADTYVAKLAEGVLLRSANIFLTSRPIGAGHLVLGWVVVRDVDGNPVPGATVSVTWTRPGGATQAKSAVANDAGLARLALFGGSGSYTLRVETITADGYTFDPAVGVRARTIQVP